MAAGSGAAEIVVGYGRLAGEGDWPDRAARWGERRARDGRGREARQLLGAANRDVAPAWAARRGRYGSAFSLRGIVGRGEGVFHSQGDRLGAERLCMARLARD